MKVLSKINLTLCMPRLVQSIYFKIATAGEIISELIMQDNISVNRWNQA
jgi:hypothetical protein